MQEGYRSREEMASGLTRRQCRGVLSSTVRFGHPNRDAFVKPLEECCTVDNPTKFEGVYAGKNVKERFAQLHKDGYDAEMWTDDMHRKEAAMAMDVGA